MIYHVYSSYHPQNATTLRRMNLVASTWAQQPWKEIPVSERTGRVFTDEAGTVPYIKDIFNIACSGKQDTDIIVFTNADICVHSNCAQLIVAALQSVHAAYAFRRDFDFLNTALPDAVIPTGTDYIGCDLFAFRVAWWTTYGDSFPDMLLGREAWDCVLRLMMDWSNEDLRTVIPNIIYHERHPTVWENHANRHRLPSQMHNLRLAKAWLAYYNVNYSRFGIK